MPSWKDRLRPASYSGIVFHVREEEFSGGRRAVVHQYPLRDRPFVEELGSEPRTFQVDGYLVGDDFAARRDLLVEKLGGPSPGFPKRTGRTLVLPTVGAVKVLCRSFLVRDSTEEGRMCRFSASFVEVGEELQPTPTPEPAGQADAAAAALGEAGAAELEDGAEVDGVIEQAREAVSGVVLGAVATLRRLDVFSGPTREVAHLEDLLTRLVAEVEVLVTAPADLAARVLEALDQVLDAASSASGALEAYRSLFSHPPLEDLGDDGQAAIAEENHRLAVELMRLAAVAGAVRAAARVDFETLEDAQEVRDELSGEIDSLEEEAGDDVLSSLAALRAVLGRSVPPPARDLPSLRTIRLPATRAALPLAFSLYQDEARADEVVRRNAVRHPLRVPGFTDLRVLSR